VSRGPGRTETHLLDLLADEWRRSGLLLADVPTLLGVEARYARRVVARLRERGEVVVSDDEDGRRVWLPKRRRVYLGDRAYFRALLDSVKNPKVTRYCANCGVPIQC
jgi:hypothetical protein